MTAAVTRGTTGAGPHARARALAIGSIQVIKSGFPHSRGVVKSRVTYFWRPTTALVLKQISTLVKNSSLRPGGGLSSTSIAPMDAWVGLLLWTQYGTDIVTTSSPSSGRFTKMHAAGSRGGGSQPSVLHVITIGGSSLRPAAASMSLATDTGTYPFTALRQVRYVETVSGQ